MSGCSKATVSETRSLLPSSGAGAAAHTWRKQCSSAHELKKVGEARQLLLGNRLMANRLYSVAVAAWLALLEQQCCRHMAGVNTSIYWQVEGHTWRERFQQHSTAYDTRVGIKTRGPANLAYMYDAGVGET